MHCLGCVAFDDLLGNGISAANFTEEKGTPARCALLCQGIHREQTEMRSPAVVPLEIVNKRPVEIPTNRYSLADSSMHHCEVFQQRLGTTRVCCISKPIFGDVQRLIAACTPVDRLQYPVQSLRVDFLLKVILSWPWIDINRARAWKTACKNFGSRYWIQPYHFTAMEGDRLFISYARLKWTWTQRPGDGTSETAPL